ncbi:hypothetical protein CGMCC3_g14736 [Colletotrichum fructicola]|nr:uncharacterized protein CGMCC3_g14736 [Colletotrichum fructicola]KAE9569224.1 hypothetical protein CGMCC3_g14736 [Colletotrichum fructicola]
MIEPTADNPQAEDTRADDDASSIGDASTQDSLASLRSSILDYRRENGRTYHRLSDGKYVLPNDEREQDRLGSWMLALERESEPLTLRTTIQKHRSSVLISVQFNLAIFCAEVRNELKRVDIHAYYDVYSVYGQKPEKEPSQAPENNPEE